MRKWSYLTIALGLAALIAGPALANNSIAASTAAAIDGTYGLAVTLDGSPNKADVRNLRPDNPGDPPGPNDETTYRASFKINMNDVVMNEDFTHNIFTMRALAGGPSGVDNRNELRISVKWKGADVNPFKLRMSCRQDDKSWAYVGGHSLPRPGVRTITVEWQASSAPGANDGICRLYVNGVLRGERTDIDNDQRTIGAVWMGVDGVRPGTIGTQYYDSFESFRTLSP